MKRDFWEELDYQENTRPRRIVLTAAGLVAGAAAVVLAIVTLIGFL